MNKRITALSYILIVCLITMLNIYIPTIYATNNNEIIPSEAIRLRIIANSNIEKDQKIKLEVRDAINNYITELVAEITTLEQARGTIQDNIPEFKQIADEIISQNNRTDKIKVDFNKIQFPPKQYGKFIYPAGEYEAIVITIGKGAGSNWWCVLFPPLCFLDFSNGQARSDGFTDEEVDTATDNELFLTEQEAEVKTTFFIKELWIKLFK